MVIAHMLNKLVTYIGSKDYAKIRFTTTLLEQRGLTAMSDPKMDSALTCLEAARSEMCDSLCNAAEINNFEHMKTHLLQYASFAHQSVHKGWTAVLNVRKAVLDAKLYPKISFKNVPTEALQVFSRIDGCTKEFADVDWRVSETSDALLKIKRSTEKEVAEANDAISLNLRQLAEDAILQLPKLDGTTQNSTKRWGELVEQLAATGIGNSACWPSAILDVSRTADEVQHIVKWWELYVATSDDIREAIWNNYDFDTKSRATSAVADIGKMVGLPSASVLHDVVVSFVSMHSIDMVVARMRGVFPTVDEGDDGSIVAKVVKMPAETRTLFFKTDVALNLLLTSSVLEKLAYRRDALMKASYDMTSDKIEANIVPWWQHISPWAPPLLLSAPFVKEFVDEFESKAKNAQDMTPVLIDNLAVTIQNITAIDAKSELLGNIVSKQGSIMGKISSYNTSMAKINAIHRLVQAAESQHELAIREQVELVKELFPEGEKHDTFLVVYNFVTWCNA